MNRSQSANIAMLDIAISTVARPQNYIYQLIQQLPRGCHIRLVVGSPDVSYLEKYRPNREIEIVPPGMAEWMNFKDCHIIHRATWNYWRCCVYGVKRKRTGGLLILEDDVIPAKGWIERFRLVREQIENQYGQEYVLSLYTCYTGLGGRPGETELYTVYPQRFFGGTQAVYYPESVRIAYAEYLRREGVELCRTAYDWLLNEYLRLTGIPLFVTTPCLFEHVGEVSTGLSPRFHQAGRFVGVLNRTRQKVGNLPRPNNGAIKRI